jgi:hypothetical protein
MIKTNTHQTKGPCQLRKTVSVTCVMVLGATCWFMRYQGKTLTWMNDSDVIICRYDLDEAK